MIPTYRTVYEGPHHNGGVLATLGYLRLAEEDAARRAYLDVAAKRPDRSRQDCPECGSGGRHAPNCKQRQIAKVSEARCRVPLVVGGCEAPGCTRKARSKGLCEPHGSQKRRGQPFTPLRAYRKRDAPPMPTGRAAEGMCSDCAHPLALHRGIVCCGTTRSGKRCRCDTGGTPCSKP